MDPQTTQSEIILGVDTHLDVHVGVVIDGVGRIKGILSIPTTPSGYEQLLAWAQSFGTLRRAGVEGTSSYGAGLTRLLQERGITVIEINRPDRSRRRGRGKSDPTDAESAARAVLADDATAVPKAQNGLAEAIRTLGVAACAALLSDDEGPVLASLKMTLRLLAKRWTALHEELRELDKQLSRLTKLAAPRLLARFGVGPQTAATLLVTAGDNPTRLRSEAALAALCGVSPISASSGKVTRHRLNRGGQRQANNALWTIAMVRMRSDARTRDYVARRTAEGLSKKEIHRCLKRYIVRELYPLILADLKDSALLA